MADVQDALGNFVNSIPWSGLGEGFTIFLLLLLVAVVGGVITFVVVTSLKFNKKIVDFENIAGQGYQPTKKERAMLVKVGDGGEEILFLQKRKQYRAAYGKKMGKNTYWFAIGQDGYPYNITIQDLDEKLGKLGLNLIDKDMRYSNVAIRRNMKERFEKTTFLEKYGGLIAYSLLIAITGIMMWLLFDKYLEISGAVTGAIDSAREVLDSTGRILSANDNILSGGSGLK